MITYIVCIPLAYKSSTVKLNAGKKKNSSEVSLHVYILGLTRGVYYDIYQVFESTI